MADTTLKGARVLLLEDDALINLSTTEILQSMGCVVRSFMHVDEAVKAAYEQVPDLAVLDVNIHGKMSYELAEWLDARQVPIVFVTGYDSPSIVGKWRDRPVCRKPCNPVQFQNLLVETFSARRDVGT
jgi:DNA-binding response OmpR family regulator